MWIVKREVLALDIIAAALAKGRIYEITEADDKYQPEEFNKVGFGEKLKKKI